MSPSNRRSLPLFALLSVVVVPAVLWVGVRFQRPDATASTPAAAAVAPEGRPVTHGQGTTVVPLKPRRVVVFDLVALDILQALEVDVHGVAGDMFPQHLTRFRDAKYPRMGTLFEPDYEALQAAKPDLIITGGRSSAKYSNLSRIAPTIDVPMSGKDFIASVIANTEMLASVFGKEEKARGLIEDLRKSVADLQQVTATRGKGLVVLVTGGRMSAYGPGSRFGVIHGDFGVPEAAEGLRTSLHGESISAEFIREKNPDWLFVIDRDAATGQKEGNARQVLDNELVRQTTAWQKNQVVYLDPGVTYLTGGGIQSVKQLRDQVASAYTQAQ
ncbi:siderophore ABC transporter substrate-binding protein [Myxococcus xanthus]|uniref:Siderophore ABC transporter substrate-binding protein n=1 Tax=Myxococcus xanthus TaxID=34 RepID=A0A7Y4MW09_MYXXA|nr:siderophore ABC transporter substrate-binding protein [Myxococcus xanthus]NOJ86198.1 siderophore ABC transporter substrate-binding protein [Myxococcus xanthus]